MVRRLPARGHYDRATLDAILDEGLICHIGFVHERSPFVIPTMYARDGDRLLLHASTASRVARTLATGTSVCVTVTLLDGLVLARSGFHHSANYRSAVVLGKARLLVDHDAKLAALETISEHIVPGRWAEVRAPSAKELRATSILELPIDEASAKIREGGPLDDETDYDRDVWAGVLPLELIARTPVADARLKDGVRVPGYVSAWRAASARRVGRRTRRAPRDRVR